MTGPIFPAVVYSARKKTRPTETSESKRALISRDETADGASQNKSGTGLVLGSRTLVPILVRIYRLDWPGFLVAKPIFPISRPCPAIFNPNNNISLSIFAIYYSIKFPPTVVFFYPIRLPILSTCPVTLAKTPLSMQSSSRFVFSHPLFRPFSWRHTPICKTRQIGPWARRDGSRAREASRDLARFVSLVLLRALVRLRSADYSLRTSYVYLPLSFSPGPLWSCLTFSLFSDIPLAHAFDHQSLSSSQVRQCRWVAPVRVRRGERKSGCTQGHGLAVKRQPGS